MPKSLAKSLTQECKNTFPKQKELFPSKKNFKIICTCVPMEDAQWRESQIIMGGFRRLIQSCLKGKKKELSPSFGESSIDEE